MMTSLRALISVQLRSLITALVCIRFAYTFISRYLYRHAAPQTSCPSILDGSHSFMYSEYSPTVDAYEQVRNSATAAISNFHFYHRAKNQRIEGRSYLKVLLSFVLKVCYSWLCTGLPCTNWPWSSVKPSGYTSPSHMTRPASRTLVVYWPACCHRADEIARIKVLLVRWFKPSIL